MRLGVHRFQALDGDVRVDLGRRELRMPEHLLEITDVRAGIMHQGRHRVPRDMHAPRLRDAGTDHVLMQPVGELQILLVGLLLVRTIREKMLLSQQAAR